MWGATLHNWGNNRNSSFNPRTRVGCDTLTNSFFRFNKFQSTHPCGVRLLRLQDENDKLVSIHAPVWGATALKFYALIHFLVSIHAPVWGATRVSFVNCINKCFNPRTRVGCDVIFTAWSYRQVMFQSTHPCGVRQRVWTC